MPDSTKSQQPKLLDQVRQVLRLHHYSIHTERSYVDWIVRFVRFTACGPVRTFPRRSQDRIVPDRPRRTRKRRSRHPEPGDECAGLPLQARPQPSLQDSINAVRADKKINVPCVMTRRRSRAVISLMDGTAQVVAKLLYGSGCASCEGLRKRPWLRKAR